MIDGSKQSVSTVEARTGSILLRTEAKRASEFPRFWLFWFVCLYFPSKPRHRRKTNKSKKTKTNKPRQFPPKFYSEAACRTNTQRNKTITPCHASKDRLKCLHCLVTVITSMPGNKEKQRKSKTRRRKQQKKNKKKNTWEEQDLRGGDNMMLRQPQAKKKKEDSFHPPPAFFASFACCDNSHPLHSFCFPSPRSSSWFSCTAPTFVLWHTALDFLTAQNRTTTAAASATVG